MTKTLKQMEADWNAAHAARLAQAEQTTSPMDWYEQEKARERQQAERMDSIAVAGEAAVARAMAAAPQDELGHAEFTDALRGLFDAIVGLIASHDPSGITPNRPCGWATLKAAQGIAMLGARELYNTEKKLDETSNELKKLCEQSNASEVHDRRLQSATEFVEALQAQRDLWADWLDAAQPVAVHFTGEPVAYEPWENRQAKAQNGRTAAAAHAAAVLARLGKK